MTDKDLIKEALDALENVIDAVYVNSELEAIAVKHANIVIAALKEALAQRTEQETDELQSLRQFRDAAFLAHPNIDLDIEAAHGIKENT